MKGGSTPILDALQDFAEAVTAKSSQLIQGAPENQLRGPFENFMAHVAGAWRENIVCTGEVPLPDRLGRPDYAVHRNGLLAGYVEIKPPGTGANATRFRGHDRDQFKRFAAIPNILYTDGNEWALYRGGERTGKLVRLSAAIPADAARGRVWRAGTAVSEDGVSEGHTHLSRCRAMSTLRLPRCPLKSLLVAHPAAPHPRPRCAS